MTIGVGQNSSKFATFKGMHYDQRSSSREAQPMHAIEWPLRSFLFVPAHRSNFIEKALRAKPDAVILDLEDSVPPRHQQEARSYLPQEIAQLSGAGIAPFVRIHAYGPDTAEEVEAIVHVGLAGVLLPKAHDAAQVRQLHDLLSYHEGRCNLPHGSIAILPLPETAGGLQGAQALAQASSRVKGIVGTVSGPVAADVARAFGFRPSMDGVEQQYMNSKLVLDSRAGGAEFPIAGVFGLPLDDLAGVERLLVRARDFGYTGSPVMHPSHVAIANRVYSPSAEEIAYCEGLIEAFEAAEKSGLGAVSYRGAMIDYAMLPHARSVVAQARRHQRC